MATQITFPAKGYSHLIIEHMAGDAQLTGAQDVAELTLTCHGSESAGEFVPQDDTVRFTGGVVTRAVVPLRTAVTVKDAAGELRVQNLAGDVSLEVVYGDLRLVRLAGVVRLGQVNGDLRTQEVDDLRLLGSCKGDARIESGQNLEVETVAGDLRIDGYAGARVNRVHGDFWASDLTGGLEAGRTDGDVRLSNIAGPVALDVVAGDLRVVGLSGGLAAASVAGDIDMEDSVGADAEYALAAQGDVSVALPADADVRLVVKTLGRIRSDVQLTPALDGSPTFAGVVGRGSARMNITAAGDLRISLEGARSHAEHEPSSAGWQDLGERIRQQVTASLAAHGIDLESGEFNFEGWRVKRGPKGHRRGPDSGSERVRDMPRPPEPPRPPVTERPRPPAARPGVASEEQMAVLRMLEAGTITADEAERLFKALGA